MKRYISLISIAICLLGIPALPTRASANDWEIAELTNHGVSLRVSGQNVRIFGAAGLRLEVFSITGAKISTVSIDSNDKSVSLNLNRGWYILRVGTLTRKIAIL